MSWCFMYNITVSLRMTQKGRNVYIYEREQQSVVHLVGVSCIFISRSVFLAFRFDNQNTSHTWLSDNVANMDQFNVITWSMSRTCSKMTVSSYNYFHRTTRFVCLWITPFNLFIPGTCNSWYSCSCGVARTISAAECLPNDWARVH